jgi:transposase
MWLEDAFTCVLANAAQIAHVPGRKTDVKDCAWIAQLVEHGLVRGSFVPPVPIRELRDLTRYRAALIGEHTRETNPLQKVLEDAGITLASVASDVLGSPGAPCSTPSRRAPAITTSWPTWRVARCAASSRRCARP